MLNQNHNQLAGVPWTLRFGKWIRVSEYPLAGFGSGSAFLFLGREDAVGAGFFLVLVFCLLRSI